MAKRGPKPKQLADRFWLKVKIGEPDSCWEWQGGRYDARCGYGGVYIEPGRYERSHRVAWMLTYGPIPDEKHVLHDCDNQPCCNPLHLYLGTEADNGRDRKRDGKAVGPTNMKGEDHPNAKLTEDGVREIRQSREIARVVADRLGVSTAAVHDVRQGRRWRHVK